MPELIEIRRTSGGLDCRFNVPKLPPSPMEIDAIKLELDEYIAQRPEKLVLHLDGWLYLPSQFLGVMIGWKRAVPTIELVNPSAAIVEVLEMTRTLAMFVCRTPSP